MKVESFEWDSSNVEHATCHGVGTDEIEEAVLGSLLVRKGRSGVYLAYGRTLGGRYVLVVFENRGRGVIRPFSARPMTPSEKSMVRRIR